MNKRAWISLLSIILPFFLFISFIKSEPRTGLNPENLEKKRIDQKRAESWMGIYMKGRKVGYSHDQEATYIKDGVRYRKKVSQSLMKVTRLGGTPLEITTTQESLYAESGRPLETQMRMKISENETVIKAEINPDRVLFKIGNEVIKEMAYEDPFYLEVPVEKIIREDGLNKGRVYSFKILDPLSYALQDCHFEIVGKEKILILGQERNLWHVKSKIDFIVPIMTDEWIDEEGRYWKVKAQAGFLETTSIRMPREKALEISGENFDIAFSTIIKSNITFEDPKKVKRMTFKVSGIPVEEIKRFPYDDGSQEILEWEDSHALLQTISQIFNEKKAISLPVKDERLLKFLKPTFFCQSDDRDIKETAEKIIGEERNAWRATKKIAEWVNREMEANYDVGFASAREILKNRQGDCSEHTVIGVALCRSVGIPARAAVGIVYGDGIFAYHMWPEVYVGRWLGLDALRLALDESTGEYYTDATHIKFGRSNLDENIFKEMAQAISEIIGKLKIEIIDYDR